MAYDPLQPRFTDNTLINPTAGWLVADASLSANILYSIPYLSPGAIEIDGCTINRTGAGSGNITTAIYKYNRVLDQYELVTNTDINTWNASATGFQTISITDTIMNSGIYLLTILADVTLSGKNSGYTTQFPYTPLGLDATGVSYQSLTKTYTYTATMPATLAADSSFWTFNNSYYGKYASFLLNQS
jgi:hypothetical protein